jgi:hypothetical protein
VVGARRPDPPLVPQGIPTRDFSHALLAPALDQNVHSLRPTNLSLSPSLLFSLSLSIPSLTPSPVLSSASAADAGVCGAAGPPRRHAQGGPRGPAPGDPALPTPASRRGGPPGEPDGPRHFSLSHLLRPSRYPAALPLTIASRACKGASVALLHCAVLWLVARSTPGTLHHILLIISSTLIIACRLFAHHSLPSLHSISASSVHSSSPRYSASLITPCRLFIRRLSIPSSLTYTRLVHISFLNCTLPLYPASLINPCRRSI